MKVDSLFDKGTAKKQEDGLINSDPYYGVTDGVTGVYLPSEGPKLFEGLTGGQLASRIIIDTFANASSRLLGRALVAANDALHQHTQRVGLPDDPAFLPGACFTVCEVDDSKVEIRQGGDSLAVWQFKDGAIEGTPNKNFAYEKLLTDTIAQLMQKHSGDRQKMWEEFRPILINERRKYSQEYRLCLLNGLSGFSLYYRWQKFSLDRRELSRVILFTDGLVPFEKTRVVDELAHYVIELYNSGGLQAVLDETRRLATLNKERTHEDLPEAAAIALEF